MTRQHFLIVEPYDPDGDHFDVEHPDDCPKVNQGDDANPVLVENCAVGFYLDQDGFSEYFLHADDEDHDDCCPRERVSEGRHVIEAWHEVHRGFDYVEYSAGVRLAAS